MVVLWSRDPLSTTAIARGNAQRWSDAKHARNSVHVLYETIATPIGVLSSINRVVMPKFAPADTKHHASLETHGVLYYFLITIHSCG
jgi:hypothetical protein